MMKRLQIIQSNIEPNKHVLWLDKYKNLNLYNGDGWENILLGKGAQSDWNETDIINPAFIKNKPILMPIATSGDSNDVLYKNSTVKNTLDNLYYLINNLEDPKPITVKHDFNSLGFVMIESGQVLLNTNNNKIPDGEYAKYIGDRDEEGNIINYGEWTNIDGDFPKSVPLEIEKIYLIKYINIDDFNNLVLIPVNITQADWDETNIYSKSFIKNKPTYLPNEYSLKFGNKSYNGSSEQIITPGDLGLSQVLTYHGISDTPLANGVTDKNIIINGSTHVADTGWVVIYDNKEFVWNGSMWEELGDLSGVDLNGYATEQWVKNWVEENTFQSNWEINEVTDPSYILNKPNLHEVATSGNYNDLINKPTIPTNAREIVYGDSKDSTVEDAILDLLEMVEGIEKPVQSDWKEDNQGSLAYIKDKPTNVSSFTNDAEYITSKDVPTYAIKAESNIITIDGSGNKVEIKGGGDTSVSTNNGIITISSTDNSTTKDGHYTPTDVNEVFNPEEKGNIAWRNGFVVLSYAKLGVDNKGHVTSKPTFYSYKVQAPTTQEITHGENYLNTIILDINTAIEDINTTIGDVQEKANEPKVIIVDNSVFEQNDWNNNSDNYEKKIYTINLPVGTYFIYNGSVDFKVGNLYRDEGLLIGNINTCVPNWIYKVESPTKIKLVLKNIQNYISKQNLEFDCLYKINHITTEIINNNSNTWGKVPIKNINILNTGDEIVLKITNNTDGDPYGIKTPTFKDSIIGDTIYCYPADDDKVIQIPKDKTAIIKLIYYGTDAGGAKKFELSNIIYI